MLQTHCSPISLSNSQNRRLHSYTTARPLHWSANQLPQSSSSLTPLKATFLGLPLLLIFMNPFVRGFAQQPASPQLLPSPALTESDIQTLKTSKTYKNCLEDLQTSSAYFQENPSIAENVILQVLAHFQKMPNTLHVILEDAQKRFAVLLSRSKDHQGRYDQTGFEIQVFDLTDQNQVNHYQSMRDIVRNEGITYRGDFSPDSTTTFALLPLTHPEKEIYKTFANPADEITALFNHILQNRSTKQNIFSVLGLHQSEQRIQLVSQVAKLLGRQTPQNTKLILLHNEKPILAFMYEPKQPGEYSGYFKYTRNKEQLDNLIESTDSKAPFVSSEGRIILATYQKEPKGPIIKLKQIISNVQLKIQ